MAEVRELAPRRLVREIRGRTLRMSFEFALLPRVCNVFATEISVQACHVNNCAMQIYRKPIQHGIGTGGTYLIPRTL